MSSRVSPPRSVHNADANFLPAIFLLFFAHFSDKLRLRRPFVLAGLLTCAVGFGINISNASNGVKYFGTFLCVTGSYSSRHRCMVRNLSIKPSPVPLQGHFRLGGNVAGQYKRAAALALHIGLGNLSGVIASNIYRTQDSPRYRLGRKSQSSPPGLNL
jgi:hypothetical protein